MLFDIHTALKLRQHYYPILQGERFSAKHDNKFITGMIVCRPDDLGEMINALMIVQNDDNLPPIRASNEAAKEFQVYVYCYDGSIIWHSPLDTKLTELNIPKIY